MKREKKAYKTPELECYGAVANFTTGGSGMRSEWELQTTGMGMMREEECVQTNRSMMKNTQMC